MKFLSIALLTVAYLDLSLASPFWGCIKSDCAPCGDVDCAPPCAKAPKHPCPPPAPCAKAPHHPCPPPPPKPHHHCKPCPPVVTKVQAPGRIIIREAPKVVAEYVEGKPLVLQQEAAPRWVFGDTCPIRLTHHSRPATVEHFETPYIIDSFQKQQFINHAAKPVVIDHYEAPCVTRDEGLPPVIQPCECDIPCECDAPCKFDVPCDYDKWY